MDLYSRLQNAASSAASFEFKRILLPKEDNGDYLVPKHDQRHLLKYWGELSDTDQTKLADQLKTLFPISPSKENPELGVTNIFHESLKHSSTLPARFEAPDPAKDMIDVQSLPAEEKQRIEAAGIDVLAQGKGAVCILAGGSGTRLGVSFPKGMLVCPDTVAPRSLFQWHCERILGLQKDFAKVVSGKKDDAAAKKIPLAIMLSPQNEVQTREFFIQNKFFGLAEDQVYFFTQSCMPCFNPNGRIVLASESSVSMAPGGNAGIYPAMYQSGVLKKLRDRGVELIQIVTVDNLLVAVADPILFGSAVVVHKPEFTGGCETTEYIDVVAKSCSKLHDHEAVGVFARRVYPQDRNPDDAPLRWGVIEYSEVGPELAAKKREGSSSSDNNQRLFDAGNIAIHLFSSSFVESAAQRMLSDFTYYHVAKKPVATSIPTEKREELYGPRYLQDAAWAPVTDKSTPAIKLEAFIFDLFQFASSFKLLNVVRSEEFSAIKNADDSNLGASSFVVASAAASEEGSETAGESAAAAAAASKPAAIKKDSPQTAVKDLHVQHAKWLVAALQKQQKEQREDSSSTASCSNLASLIATHNLRVELAPIFAPRAASLLLNNTAIKLGDGVVGKVAEYCDGGKATLLVVFVNEQGEISAVDMSKGRTSTL